MKLSKYAKTIGISYKIAWSHYSKGLIPGAYQLATGTIIVPDELLERSKEKSNGNRVAIYARVSSHENKSNLAGQAGRLKEYATAKGYQIAYVEKEIGSGVNDNRKKLDALLKKDDWTILLIEHKDRLTRFGFNYLKTLLEKQGKKIEVVNVAEDETGDLMQDLVAIIYSFSARMYGIRRGKRKTEKIIAELKAKE
jgi:predicted site-specific integrase-resolvase